MAWLSDWLRQIIAVILLAGIIELLLPSSAYQRYIRLVVGMLILLILLSPVLQLLQGDYEGKLTDSFKAWNRSLSSSSEMMGLEQIRQQAQRIKEDQQQQAALLAEKHLAASIEAEVERITGLDLLGMSVKLEKNGRTGDDRIVKANVYLSNMAPEQLTDAQEEEEEIVPVESIAVDVTIPIVNPAEAQSVGHKEGTADTADSKGAADQWLPATDERVRRIAAVLSAGWGIAPGDVRVSAAAAEG
ncbi:stage III sporulation protein AF [Paenibacillus abyssi]|uniref:Stage III sporulation protein AF n=1 Tax=Paenibacillus abyssi TaxID=1340531 RepID=A0A917FL70_9BACL|nr:stage III sporulation protein AF [Paenibacillus abyssi]GGF87032.1 hypothetical protein GCM10010916_00500 [Paenibacillus abyssi]